MNYYFLRQDLFGDATGSEIEGHTETTAAFDWVAGAAFATPFPVETLWLTDVYGQNVPDFLDTTIPVMSLRLVETLTECGVANLDVYPVVLRSRSGGMDRENYRAINVVGVVDAVDLASSPHEMRRGKPRFGAAIAIDEQRTAGLLAFRLPHSPRFIVVTEPVARSVRAAKLDSVLLQLTTDYRGT